MSQKTTIYLDPIEYGKLKAIAASEGRRPAALIREAVGEYTRRHTKSRRPATIGSGRSRRGDIARNAEKYLKGFGLDR